MVICLDVGAAFLADGHIGQNGEALLPGGIHQARNGLYVGRDAYILTDVSEEAFAVKEIGYANGDALEQALACCARLAADNGFSGFTWDAPESAPLPRQAQETRLPWVMARVTGGSGLSTLDAAAATRHLLNAPDPRLWVGEIT